MATQRDLRPVSERSRTRDHESTTPHFEAVQRYQEKRGPAARKARADERTQVRSLLTPWDQRAELNLRLGAGQGAKRERARLEAQIHAAEVSKTKATIKG